MNAMTAAVAGAVMSGVVVYAIGMRADDRTGEVREMVASAASAPAAILPAPEPAGVAVAAPRRVVRTVRTVRVAPVAARPVVYDETRPAVDDEWRPPVREADPVVQEEMPAGDERADEPADAAAGRSWQKTALVIGGAAASGAGVGAIVDGKKGALIGAAIGGGAASIYEATRRR